MHCRTLYAEGHRTYPDMEREQMRADFESAAFGGVGENAWRQEFFGRQQCFKFTPGTSPLLFSSLGKAT